MTHVFPPESTIDFKSFRSDTLLLSVTSEGGTGYLGVLYADEQAAKAGVEAVFTAGETLSDVLDVISPAALFVIDPSEGRPLLRQGRAGARPCAILTRADDGVALTVDTASGILREWLASAQAGKDPGGAAGAQEGRGAPPASLRSPELGTAAAGLRTDADEIPLADWRDPGGRMNRLYLFGPAGRRVGIRREGQDEPIVFDTGEVPDLLHGLGLVPVTTAAAVPARAVPAAQGKGRLPLVSAVRVVLARLYAAYPEGLSAAELEEAATATGLEPGLAEAALAQLEREGRVDGREGVHRVRP